MIDCNCKYRCEEQFGVQCRIKSIDFIDGNKVETKTERLNDSIPCEVVLKRMGGYLKGLEQTIENNQQLIDHQKLEIYKQIKTNEAIIDSVKLLYGNNAYQKVRAKAKHRITQIKNKKTL